MENQVLSIEQMNHLQTLGVDTSKASIFWCEVKTKGCNPFLILTDRVECLNLSPGFTLQDMLAIVPPFITAKGSYRDDTNYTIRMDRDEGLYFFYFIYQKNSDYDVLVCFQDENILISAYKMICWLAENKHL